jgi:molecular chaperone GrpE
MTDENAEELVQTEELDIQPDLEEELRSQKDKYLRLLAENENVRKRMQKEKYDTTRFGIENVISEFLAPIDSFEQALGFADQMSEETKNWAMGFTMILEQLKEVLTSRGITPFTSKGEMFDPHRHEAVEAEETDAHPDGTILEEFLRGYIVNDRVLRPARVKVAKAPKTEELQQGESDDKAE